MPDVSLPHKGCPPIGSKWGGKLSIAATISRLVDPKSRTSVDRCFLTAERPPERGALRGCGLREALELREDGADGGGEDEHVAIVCGIEVHRTVDDRALASKRQRFRIDLHADDLRAMASQRQRQRPTHQAQADNCDRAVSESSIHRY